MERNNGLRSVRRGRASGAALAAFLGVIVGAVLVWVLARPASAPVSAAQGTPVAALPAVSAASQDAITTAVEKVGPAVVNIAVMTGIERMPGMRPQARGGEGSGVIIDGRNGYILTNAHVVKGAKEVVATLADGRHFDAKVIGMDPLTEVAVVKVPADNLPQATLGSAENMPIGSWVIAIGNPYGLENSVTVGVLSAKERQFRAPNQIALEGMLQTDASINPGNSGGALVDLNGNLIGMPTAVISSAQGIGFAVSIDVAKQAADQLIRTGKIPWLGIQHGELRPEQAKRLGLPSSKGTMVFSVATNGPADRAGIKPEDLIVEADGKPVEKARDLSKAVRAHDAGDSIEIKVVRGGKEMMLKVTLGAVPADIGGG